MENINELQKLFEKYVTLNKLIVNNQAIAVVPGKRIANISVSDLDIEEDYIFFCFTKFTKTLISIWIYVKFLDTQKLSFVLRNLHF